MTDLLSILNDVPSWLVGFFGIAFGFFLSSAKDWWISRKEKEDAKTRLVQEVSFNCDEILWGSITQFPPAEALDFQTLVWESLITSGKFRHLPKDIQAKATITYQEMAQALRMSNFLKGLSSKQEFEQEEALANIGLYLNTAYEYGCEIREDLAKFKPKIPASKQKRAFKRLERDIKAIEDLLPKASVPSLSENKTKD
ncbi:MAG: hypothetical protein ACE5OZ_04230 [Candidatus Heimdallarchaeota archaeon]